MANGLLLRSAAGVADPSRLVDIVVTESAAPGVTPISYPDYLERARALPSITAATLADHAPGPGGRSLGVLTVPGFASPDGRSSVFMNWTLVEPGFFTTLRIPLLAGRDFSDADRESRQPVAIVGEAAAKRSWPGREAVGQSLLLHSTNPNASSAPTRIVVVGVARDLRFQGLGNSARLDVYAPLGQRYSGELTLLARRDAGDRPSRVAGCAPTGLSPR